MKIQNIATKKIRVCSGKKSGVGGCYYILRKTSQRDKLNNYKNADSPQNFKNLLV